MPSLEEKIIQARRSYILMHKREPDCVIIDEHLEGRLDPKVFSAKDLTIAGMHVIFAHDIPHSAIRCGRMR